MKKELRIFGLGFITGVFAYSHLNKSKKSKDDSAPFSIHEIDDAPPYNSVPTID